jgi:hypothetical protein
LAGRYTRICDCLAGRYTRIKWLLGRNIYEDRWLLGRKIYEDRWLPGRKIHEDRWLLGRKSILLHEPPVAVTRSLRLSLPTINVFIFCPGLTKLNTTNRLFSFLIPFLYFTFHRNYLIPFRKYACALNCLGRVSFCETFSFYGVQGQY